MKGPLFSPRQIHAPQMKLRICNVNSILADTARVYSRSGSDLLDAGDGNFGESYSGIRVNQFGSSQPPPRGVMQTCTSDNVIYGYPLPRPPLRSFVTLTGESVRDCLGSHAPRPGPFRRVAWNLGEDHEWDLHTGRSRLWGGVLDGGHLDKES